MKHLVKKWLPVAMLTLALLPVSAAFAAPAPDETFRQEPFTDVQKGSTYFEAVEYFRENNVLKGYPDGTFRPNARITRAEAVVLLTNPLFLTGQRVNDCTNISEEQNAELLFPDVHSSSWYADEVCFGKLKGIVHGYPDGTFKPNRTVSVVEAAKIVATVFQIKIRDEAGTDEKWYTGYIQELAGRKALPTSIKSLSRPITRGELAEMVFRLKTDRTDKPSQTWQALIK
jgi:hypothetical protein